MGSKQRAEMKPGETPGRARRLGRRRARRGGNRQGHGRAGDRLRLFRRKARLRQSHGADETINYASEDLRAALKRLAGASGVDVVYDPVGGAPDRSGAALARLEGRLSGDRLRLRRDPRPPLN